MNLLKTGPQTGRHFVEKVEIWWRFQYSMTITSTWFQEHTLIAQVAFLVQIAGKIAMEW